MRSLRTRLLLAATLVLVLFMLLSGAALEQAFRSSAQEAQEEKMQALVYAMIGAADTGENETLTIPANALPDPRLGRVQSGLAALIFDIKGRVIWRSGSFEGPMPDVQAPRIGEATFTEFDDQFVLSYGMSWAADTGSHAFGSAKPRRYTVAVLEDKTPYRTQLGVFRRTLWIGLGVAATALLLLQLLVLRWSLAPLRRLARELSRIESGEQTRIEASYPDELTPLTSGLNTMIQGERNQQSRYRNALDDLAHSLKTPLAVLRGLVEDRALEPSLRERLGDPVGRIQEITDHQLRKAATAGRRTFAEPVRLRPLAEKIGGALAKVYADKQPEFTLDIADTLRARADEGDLYELLGNLMDNAGKWCRHRIRVSASYAERKLRLSVEDDGPGFPADADKLLQRGMRADSQTPGQGIGLGAVAEMVRAYDGSITLGRSELGGGLVDVALSV
ncbi:MAG: ATP-binding protein [Nevskia sp.]|nr:ATP-binding protein [Nevskia sp.]